MYALLGKAVWRYLVVSVRRRYGKQIRLGAGLGAVGLGIAVYFATRDVPEG